MEFPLQKRLTEKDQKISENFFARGDGTVCNSSISIGLREFFTRLRVKKFAEMSFVTRVQPQEARSDLGLNTVLLNKYPVEFCSVLTIFQRTVL